MKTLPPRITMHLQPAVRRLTILWIATIVLKISPGWRWKDAFLTCWKRLCALPAPV
jgi:hypothetical protein